MDKENVNRIIQQITYAIKNIGVVSPKTNINTQHFVVEPRRKNEILVLLEALQHEINS